MSQSVAVPTPQDTETVAACLFESELVPDHPAEGVLEFSVPRDGSAASVHRVLVDVVFATVAPEEAAIPDKLLDERTPFHRFSDNSLLLTSTHGVKDFSSAMIM